MTRILRNTVAAAFVTAGALTLAGCPSGTGANIPGTGGVLGASTAPGTSPSMAPGSSACNRTVPSDAARGTSEHGAYNNQLLPPNWSVQLKSEVDVYKAIAGQANGADWNCFKTFYPGATSLYEQGKGKM